MEEKGILIVDDSSFSIAVIKNILEDNGFNVVGQASSLEEVKKAVVEKKPSLVTMDMTLVDTDGLECTRAIHEIDENIKVIVVSSMMDDEIVKEAKLNRVSGYVQKPVDEDELIMTIKRVMDSENLYKHLEEEYPKVFKESLLDTMNKMTKTLLSYKDEYSGDKEFESKGITIIIGIIGKFSGRMLIDLSQETASNMISAIMGNTINNNDEINAALGEFTNIIAGNACSLLNRRNSALGLRVAPPSILRGDNVVISPSDFSTRTILGESNFGEIFLNVGFKRSEEAWM